jgi:hypothetical protein
MNGSESEAQLRQQIFLFSIGIFLMTYLVSLYRFRSFEWAMITSSVAFGVTILAGALMTAFIRLHDEPAETKADAAPEAGTGAGAAAPRVDGFHATGDFDLSGQAAD